MNNEIVLPYSILFVEDESAIRANYVSFLKRYYKNVFEAENGERAWKVYQEKRPDILIVDIHIPKLNGLELVRKIRVYDQNTKIIMLTAFADTKYLLEATELNLVKYLVKPVTREVLKDALALAIESLENFTTHANKFIKIGENILFNRQTSELFDGNVSIYLTKSEAKLLALLFSSVNRLFTYDEIVGYLWNNDGEDKIDSLKTLIKTLRRKLPPDTIVNVFGSGYKIVI